MTFDNDFVCNCGRCMYDIVPYIKPRCYFHRGTSTRRKAGGFITDRENKFVLLVQSCGKMWGPPKGTVEPNETVSECAAREIREETGLDVTRTAYAVSSTYVRFKSRYYYYNITVDDPPPVRVQLQSGNDANGVGWFSVDCVVRNIKAGTMHGNQHLKYVFDHFIGVTL